MGATTFVTKIPMDEFPSVEDAFREATRLALHDFGHDGYSGSIAEKSGFELFDVDCSMDLDDFIEALEGSRPGKVLDEVYEMAGEVYGHGDRIVEVFDSKWGPAVAFEYLGEWVFCGWASC
jgi:hypothetical protein